MVCAALFVFIFSFFLLIAKEKLFKASVGVRSGNTLSFVPEREAAKYALEYDFGTVTPEKKLTHCFLIHNDTSLPWVVRKIHRSCSCTVGRLSRPVIPPGENGEVELTYRTPSGEGNDRRTITIEFEDEQSPYFELTIRARIREPLSITPKEINFLPVSKGRQLAEFLQIRNHTEEDIELYSVKSDSRWLSVDPPILENVKGPAGDARQIWRVPIRAATRDLTSGWHTANIEVRTSDAKAASSKSVTVHLQVMEPVVACPEQMFFGTVPPQGTTSRTIRLRFASDEVAPSSTKSIIVRHDLGESLRLSCTRRTATSWELSAVFAAGREQRLIAGTIEVSFPGLSLPSLKIPVVARVEAR